MKLMRVRPLVPATMSILFVFGSQAFGQSTGHEGQELSIQPSQVPQPALDAAQKVLGSTPTKAGIVVGTDPQVYDLQATNQSGKVVGVNVLADGKVLKKERQRKAGAGS
jgi:hypothetical protein